MLGSYDKSKVAMVVTIAWAIWGNRNEVRNGGNKKSGRDIVQWTTRYLEEYYVAYDRPVVVPVVQAATWTPPPNETYKINIVDEDDEYDKNKL